MESPVYAVVKFTVDKERLEEYLMLADYFVNTVRETEKGNIFYHLVKIDGRDYEYMFIGAWKSREAVEDHFNSELFQEKVPKMGSMFVEFESFDTTLVF